MKKWIIVSVLLLSFISGDAFAKEIGDIMIHKGGKNYDSMWGLTGYGVNQLFYPGHTMLYLGADDEGNEWIVDCGPEKFRNLLKTRDGWGGIMFYKYNSQPRLYENVLGPFSIKSRGIEKAAYEWNGDVFNLTT